jgi:hypothetical protein
VSADFGTFCKFENAAAAAAAAAVRLEEGERFDNSRAQEWLGERLMREGESEPVGPADARAAQHRQGIDTSSLSLKLCGTRHVTRHRANIFNKLGDVPGERRPYVSGGGLESSRVALVLVSIAHMPNGGNKAYVYESIVT